MERAHLNLCTFVLAKRKNKLFFGLFRIRRYWLNVIWYFHWTPAESSRWLFSTPSKAVLFKISCIQRRGIRWSVWTNGIVVNSLSCRRKSVQSWDIVKLLLNTWKSSPIYYLCLLSFSELYRQVTVFELQAYEDKRSITWTEIPVEDFN